MLYNCMCSKLEDQWLRPQCEVGVQCSLVTNLVTNLSPNLVTNLVITKQGDKFVTKFVTKFGVHQIWWQIHHWIWCSPNSVIKLVMKLVTKLSPFLVTNLVLTKLGDECVIKFGEHQVCHQIWWQFCHSFLCLIWWQYWWSPNLVTNFSPNLVKLLVISKFSDVFSSNFTKNVDHLNLSYICIWSTQ